MQMIDRRNFLKLGLMSLVFSASSSSRLFSSLALGTEDDLPLEKRRLIEIIRDDVFPFPYDENYFECAERIYNVRRAPLSGRWLASLNLILKPGRTLDLRVVISDSLEGLLTSKNIIELNGVQNNVDITMEGEEGKRAYYKVFYREGKESWKELAPKSFKLPFVNLEKGETIKVIFIGDDHTFDDADRTLPETLRQSNLNGNYIIEFMRGLKNNSNWQPSYPLSALKNGLFLAKAVNHILSNEDPDMVILLGDTTGLGAYHRWEEFGLPTANLKDSDYNWIAQLFWLRLRKLFSAISPYAPVYIVLGNHDGEAQWNATNSWGAYWRQKYFTSPDDRTYPEGGHPEGKYYAFSWGADSQNRGGVLFVVLNTTAFSGTSFPSRIEQWTLGESQRLWLENTLQRAEKDWIFICSHHVFGGWPAGPEETQRDIAYGRGPLFLAEDYKDYGNPEKIEQVWITQKAKENGVRAFIYGHDHVFFSRDLGSGLNNLGMRGICVGSTKYVGETGWWLGSLWKKHYGSYSRIPPDFWGPSGITRATISAREARFDYVVTALTSHSNLPPTVSRGSCLSSVIIANPPAQLSYTPDSLSLRCYEDEPSPTEGIIRIKNAGSGRLPFRLKTNAAWLKVDPAEGESWGKEKTIKVNINTNLVAAGNYSGLIEIECLSPAQGYGKVKVDLVVDPPPLFPPINLTGQKKYKTVQEEIIIYVTLSWRAHPKNKKVKGYRIYLFDRSKLWILLAEVPKSTRSFSTDRIDLEFPLTFGVSTVDQRDRESDKATVIVK
jgi:3',5'-cyclic AMP phosphodiesterase CpdA